MLYYLMSLNLNVVVVVPPSNHSNDLRNFNNYSNGSYKKSKSYGNNQKSYNQNSYNGNNQNKKIKKNTEYSKGKKCPTNMAINTYPSQVGHQQMNYQSPKPPHVNNINIVYSYEYHNRPCVDTYITFSINNVR